MGLVSLVLYGVGDILGAGVYGLIGRAARQMGNAVWMAFLISAVAALLTGLSYACLGSRYPRAGGAAYITQRAFGRPLPAYIVGIAVMAAGITSMATASRIFAGYFQAFAEGIPSWCIIAAFLTGLTLINLRGIRESAWANAVCTWIEAGGLLLIIGIGARYIGTVDYLDIRSVEHPDTGVTFPLIFNGAVLTFYSFLGFEDMLNVSEEVKHPRRSIPIGMLLAIGIATLIYLLISIVAVSVVPHAELAASDEPLVEVVRRAAPWFPTSAFTGVALFAVSNTALLCFIMSSRLAYGMACQGLLPAPLARVHPVRRTPHIAIFTVIAIVVPIVLLGDITILARATSVMLLGVFIMINASLIVLSRRPGEPEGLFRLPLAVPAGGVLVCAAMLLNSGMEELRIALLLLGAIVVLYRITRPPAFPPETAPTLPGDREA